MPRFVYAWNVNTDRWGLRAVVGPVDEAVADSVDRVLDRSEVEAVLAELDAACPPPWWVHGEMLAGAWTEVEDRVRSWHFT